MREQKKRWVLALILTLILPMAECSNPNSGNPSQAGSRFDGTWDQTPGVELTIAGNTVTMYTFGSTYPAASVHRGYGAVYFDSNMKLVDDSDIGFEFAPITEV